MKAVKRWRYYCDFCKKAGQSGFHIKNHESSCTLNPQRVCKMCVKADGEQAPMSAMLDLLPEPVQFMVTTPARTERFGWDNDGDSYEIPACTVMDDDAMRAALVPAMKALRDLTMNCPVCILAALRQKKIPVPLAEDFNFTKELESALADCQQEESYY